MTVEGATERGAVRGAIMEAFVALALVFVGFDLAAAAPPADNKGFGTVHDGLFALLLLLLEEEAVV